MKYFFFFKTGRPSSLRSILGVSWGRIAVSALLMAGLFFSFSCSNNQKLSDHGNFFEIITSDFQNNSDGGMLARLNTLINETTLTLDCAFSRLNDDDIIDSLKNLAQKNYLKIQLAFDFSGTSDKGYNTLLELPASSRPALSMYIGNRKDGAFNHNFCMVDKRKIWLSTSPIDSFFAKSAPQIALMLGGDEFGLGREFLKEITLFSEGLYGSRKSKLDFKTKFLVLDQVIELRWGPQESPMAFLSTELSDTDETISGYSSSLQTTSNKADKDLASVLNRKANEGIHVNMVFDSAALGETTTAYHKLNAQIKRRQLLSNNIVKNLQFFILDKGSSQQRVLLFSGKLRSKGDSSDDSMVLMLRGKFAVDLVQKYYDQISAASRTISVTPYNASGGEVIINEIHWMGSRTNDGINLDYDEFIELKNLTSQTLNLSDWQLACRDGSNKVNPVITIFKGAEIPPNGYFVVASDPAKAFSSANYFSSQFGSSQRSISNSTVECILTDGDSDIVAGPFGDKLNGTIVDTAGDGTTPFNQNEKKFASKTGFNDSSLNYKGAGKRSMERISSSLSGQLLSNWQSNMFTPEQNIYVENEFQRFTFASPGVANSVASVQNIKTKDIVINEILVSGSIPNTYTSNSGNSNDEFIELKNISDKTIELTNWYLTNAGAAADKRLPLPLGLSLKPGEIFVIRNDATKAILGDFLTYPDIQLDDNATEIELKNYADVTIDRYGDSASAIKDFGGFYYRDNCTPACARVASAERSLFYGNGDQKNSWHINSFSAVENTYINTLFRQVTYASPGQENSPRIGQALQSGDLIISELHWAGSRNTLSESYSDDDFIEIYNNTDNVIDLSFVSLQQAGNNTFGQGYLFPRSTSIEAGAYLVVAKYSSGWLAFNHSGLTFSQLTLSSSAKKIQIVDAFKNVIDSTPANSSWPAGSASTPRTSMERRTPITDGSLTSSWLSAIYAGNHVEATSFAPVTFATPREVNSVNAPSTVPPQVLSTMPANGSNDIPRYAKNIEIHFTKAMDSSSFSTASISLDNGATIASFNGLSNGGKTAHFTVALDGGNNHTYTITVFNTVKDISGNFMTANNTANSFTTVANANAVVLISKVLASSSPIADAVELKVLQAGTLSGIKINISGATRYTFPATTSKSVGDVIVAYLYPGADAGNDYYSATTYNISSTDSDVEIQDSLGNTFDFVSIVDGDFAANQETRMELQKNKAQWKSNLLSSTPLDAVDSSLDSTAGHCLIRNNNGSGTYYDTNSYIDFQGSATCNLGANGPSVSAPSFNLLGAESVSQTQIRLNFSHALLSADVVAANFSSNNGLTISGVQLDGKSVLLTTSVQSSGAEYTVSANAALQRFGDNAVIATNSSLAIGYTNPAVLQITEVHTLGPSDKIEFKVLTGGSLTSLRVLVNNSLVYTFPQTGVFNAGEMIVLYTQATSGTNGDETKLGGTTITSSNGSEHRTTAYDFYSSTGSITSTDAEIEIQDPQSSTQDYIAYSDGVLGSGQAARVEVLVASGHWQDGGDGVQASDLVYSGSGTGNCLQRRNDGANTEFIDTNSKGDWVLGVCEIGAFQETLFKVQDQVSVISSTKIKLTFNWNVQNTSAQNLSAYCLEQSGGAGNCPTISGFNATLAEVSGKELTLTFDSPLTIGANYILFFSQIVDDSYQLSPAESSITFQYQEQRLLFYEIARDVRLNNDNDYIVLYNPTSASQNLKQYYMGRDASCNLPGGFTYFQQLPDRILPAGGYFLLAHADNTLTIGDPDAHLVPDSYYAGVIADGDCLVITNSSTQPTSLSADNIIDIVSFNATTYEGTARAGIINPGNRAFTRKGSCGEQDTNENADDFTLTTSPTYIPKSSATPSCLP